MIARRVILLAIVSFVSFASTAWANGGGGGSKGDPTVSVENRYAGTSLILATDSQAVVSEILAAAAIGPQEGIDAAKARGAQEVSQGDVSKKFSVKAGQAYVLAAALDGPEAGNQDQLSFNIRKGENIRVIWNGFDLTR